MKTFGEFFDAVEQWAEENANEGEFHLENWVALSTPEKWEQARKTELTLEHFRFFAEDMASYIMERLQGICTDALYQVVTQEGHEFLKAIIEIGRTSGLQFADNEINLPLTPTEALARASATS